MMKNKKGLSPVIATILLISIVVVLGLIILIWALSFIEEVVEKEVGGEKVSSDQACREINLEASLSGGNLHLINRGNIPVYQIEIRKKSLGRVDIDPHIIKLGSGESTTISSDADAEEVIPAILGESDGIKKIKSCLDYPVKI